MMDIYSKRQIGICMADLKVGENMSGKFNNSKNGVYTAYCFIIIPTAFIGGAVIAVKVGRPEIGLPEI